MVAENWFMQEDLWVLQKPVIFNSERIRNTFLEVNRILKLTALTPGEKVLDLGCGIGRHSLEFASRGFEVTGVDLTASFLTTAAENARSQKVDVRYVQGDMRTYCEPDTYGLIINMFTSFGYFTDSEDDVRVLSNCFQSLHSGGILMLEMLGKEVVAANIKSKDVLSYGDYQVITHTTISNNWSWLECKWTIIRDKQVYETRYAHRLYAATEMARLLEEAGFSEVSFFGDLTGAPYDNMARSMLIVAKK
ncbi:class I SAM-dependent methyltransferase [Chitinophaga rhizophila]|uniref:Methyltransferase domain-containing protein n=1 Tax=Chitinophaga rhizophila TaxID=2866212 RepID=A0ABS7G7E6_9BACT|nr:class I SAM-dependent methyltransferase [Chitinophaga rhizophila]MBW8683060.1 methyltransferase domain-containing protein [Chitinophaga rhizophila]